MTALHALGGGVKYATYKHFADILVSSLEVEEFRSLEGFTCWLGKAEQLPLLWGGRSCVSIANYRFGEGVEPVWCKGFDLIVSSLAVYKFSSLAEFIEEDCKIISSLYRGRIKVGAIPKGGLPC